MSLYQTVKYKNGIEIGAFPTLDWFVKIPINFKGLSLVDIGCAEGMYALMAREKGATRVVCVDTEKSKTDACDALFREYGYEPEVYTTRFEDRVFDMDYDVVFMNMILHWLQDSREQFERVLDATKKYVVVIYRPFNPGYKEGTWFPNEGELENVAKANGFEVAHKETLMTQDNGKTILLTVFKRYKDTKPIINYVEKYHAHYDKAWLKKLTTILPHLYNHTVIEVRLNYVKQEYIDGRDLWGDRPFHPTHGRSRQVFLNIKEKESIQKLLSSIEEAGQKTGYWLSDINKRNIILKDEEAYVVDLEHIETKDKQRIYL